MSDEGRKDGDGTAGTDGTDARAFDPDRKYTDEERDHVERGIEEVYDRFTSRVAEGRGLTQERVNELGRGRIWSGADALERGLVDELGDLRLGLQRARELAGLPLSLIHI